MFYFNHVKVHQTRASMFLAYPGEARGCSTKTERILWHYYKKFKLNIRFYCYIDAKCWAYKQVLQSSGLRMGMVRDLQGLIVKFSKSVYF